MIVANNADEPPFLTLIPTESEHKVMARIALEAATDGIKLPGDNPHSLAVRENDSHACLPLNAKHFGTRAIHYLRKESRLTSFSQRGGSVETMLSPNVNTALFPVVGRPGRSPYVFSASYPAIPHCLYR